MQRYFKTGPGEYAAGDVFIGVRVPATRLVAKTFRDLPLAEVAELLRSKIHEERLLALLILGERHARAEAAEQTVIYQFYLDHLAWVYNWDLVDTSAPAIVGRHLLGRSREILYELAGSPDLWRRRVAILATLTFIRAGDFEDTLRLAEQLRTDPHDLMHKAVGWMLREVGKRNVGVMRQYLDRHAACLPRTLLRYAIEKLPARERAGYLGQGKMK